jgi:hypothetical protein
MASSHAFAFLDPVEWDDARRRNRESFERKYGFLPPEQPGVAKEDDATVADAYAELQANLRGMAEDLRTTRPDVLIVIGDDQNENFNEQNLPQLAMFVGDGFDAVDRMHPGSAAIPYRSDGARAWRLLESMSERGFEFSSVKRFPDDQLLAHAISPALEVLMPTEADRIPVILLFVEAIRPPAPTPRRCYELGKAIREALESWTDDDARIAIYGSGGLSHFTAGYPYAAIADDRSRYGSISTEFDRQVLAWLETAEADRLAGLSGAELLQHGDVELRSWIVVAGAIGEARPSSLTYVPLYRALTGLGAAHWRADRVDDRERASELVRAK